MDSLLTLNSFSSRQLSPLLHPYPQPSLRSQIPRHHRLFIHSSLKPPLKPPQLLLSPSSLRSSCKTLSFALFLAFLSFVPIPASRLLPAIALPSTTQKTEKGENFTDHEFSTYTRRLLSLVSLLLSRIEDARSGKGDMNGVKKALKEIKSSRRKIEGEVIANLNAELSEMKRTKVELSERSDKVLELVRAAVKELEMLDRFEMEEGRRKGVEELEMHVGDLEREYNDLVAKIGEIEDRMMMRESLTYSVAVRELSFIERESELLVRRFGRRIARYSLLRNDFMLPLSNVQIFLVEVVL